MTVSRKCTADQGLAAPAASGMSGAGASEVVSAVQREITNFRKGRPASLIDAAAALTALAWLCFPPICSRQSRRERSAQEAGAEGATAPETLRQTDRATC